jgi:hypothetical protein
MKGLFTCDNVSVRKSRRAGVNAGKMGKMCGKCNSRCMAFLLGDKKQARILGDKKKAGIVISIYISGCSTPYRFQFPRNICLEVLKRSLIKHWEEYPSGHDVYLWGNDGLEELNHHRYFGTDCVPTSFPVSVFRRIVY